MQLSPNLLRTSFSFAGYDPRGIGAPSGRAETSRQHFGTSSGFLDSTLRYFLAAAWLVPVLMPTVGVLVQVHKSQRVVEAQYFLVLVSLEFAR